MGREPRRPREAAARSWSAQSSTSTTRTTITKEKILWLLVLALFSCIDNVSLQRWRCRSFPDCRATATTITRGGDLESGVTRLSRTFTLGVVNVWGDERLGWWTSEVVNVWGGERLGWWTSDFTQGVVNVWGGERLGWWMSGWWTSYNPILPGLFCCIQAWGGGSGCNL